MRLRRRVKKILFWGTLLFLATVVGGGIFAYTYVTDSTTLANLIREQAPNFLPNARVNVQHVRVRPFLGEVVLKEVLIQQFEGKGIPHLVGRFPWVNLSFDPRALLDGRFVPRSVVVPHPQVRLRRRADGSWNVQGLLADPWPLDSKACSPPIKVEHGTVELVDDTTPDAKPLAVLRDVSLNLTSKGEESTVVNFVGSANGRLFERVQLEGTLDKATGRVTLKGDVTHVALAELLRAPLPSEVRPTLDAVRLTGGEVDLAIRHLVYNPKATRKLTHETAIRLRAGVWSPTELPYPINDLSASVTVRDDLAIIERAEGFNGPTTVRAKGWANLAGPNKGGFDLEVDVLGLELDDRLKEWTPAKFRPLWAEYKPKGRIDAAWHGVRKGVSGELDWGLGVGLRDVSMEYHLFRYPLDRVTGELSCKEKWIEFDLTTQINGKPAKAVGKIVDPGPNPAINIEFTAGALPIDKMLKNAMPPDVRKVVDTFSPTGTVQGKATLTRKPVGPGDDPKKAVRFDAEVDMNPDCEMTWDGLKYKVSNLTGHLEIHPDLWVIRNMKGSHGQATVKADGQVSRSQSDEFQVDLQLDADNLLFDQQLRDALPPAWSKSTWETLNPTGASDVEATITVRPGQRDHYLLKIHPRPETNLRLSFERTPEAGETDTPPEARRLEMRLENIAGMFVFDDGKVKLYDGGFMFRGSPVKFARGEVQVFDSGQFTLGVEDLYVKDFRLDAGLRKMMPPLMAEATRRLDDGKTFTMRGNLGLEWSGKSGETPKCSWDKGLVVLNGNSIQAGMPIRAIQGQVENLHGSFNGQALTVGGAILLDSVNLFDQQITKVSTPIEVSDGKVRLTNIQATLLEGQVAGNLEISLDETPRFQTNISLAGAKLESYAKTQPGRQTYRGLVNARAQLEGIGSDPHTLQGAGEAEVTQGDLGKLPFILVFLKALQLAPTTKTAFDSARVHFAVRNGETEFDPILFTGDAFSLQGRGTLDPQTNLDIKLRVLYGRDTWHLPVLSDAMREASGQFFVIRVGGTLGFPDPKLVPFPQASKFVKSLGAKRAEKIEMRRK